MWYGTWYESMHKQKQWSLEEDECSKTSQVLGGNVCKERSKELGKKVSKKSSKELGRRSERNVAREDDYTQQK